MATKTTASIFLISCLLWTPAQSDYSTYILEDTICASKSGLNNVIHIPSTGAYSAAMIKSRKGSEANRNSILCHVSINTQAGYKLIIAFESMQLPNCQISKLELTNVPQSNNAYCNLNQVPQTLLSKNNQFNLTWIASKKDDTDTGEFSMIVTATTGISPRCGLTYHKCKTGYCIDKSLTCDGTDNCGDLSDEHNCSSGDIGLSFATIFSICLIILFILIAVLICLSLRSLDPNRKQTSSIHRNIPKLSMPSSGNSSSSSSLYQIGNNIWYRKRISRNTSLSLPSKKEKQITASETPQNKQENVLNKHTETTNRPQGVIPQPIINRAKLESTFAQNRAVIEQYSQPKILQRIIEQQKQAEALRRYSSVGLRPPALSRQQGPSRSRLQNRLRTSRSTVGGYPVNAYPNSSKRNMIGNQRHLPYRRFRTPSLHPSGTSPSFQNFGTDNRQNCLTRARSNRSASCPAPNITQLEHQNQKTMQGLPKYESTDSSETPIQQNIQKGSQRSRQ